MYQYQQHGNLNGYLDDLKQYSSADLQAATAMAGQLLHDFISTPNDSFEAKRDFHNKLAEGISSYYKSHFYNKKSTWQKFKYFFGAVNKNEKSLLDIKHAAKKNYQLNNKLFKTSWSIGPDLGLQLRLRGISKKTFTNAKLFSDQKFFKPEMRLTIKLKLIAHWLMGDKDYSDVDVLQGLPREYTAYKLKREVEKFKQQYAADLNDADNQQLEQVILMLEKHCELLGAMMMSKMLRKNFNNPRDKERLADLDYRVCKTLDELQPGERYLLPHGYIADDSGHATLVEFIKNADSTMQVKFINTGSGVTKHLTMTDISAWFNAIVRGKISISAANNYALDQIFTDNLVEQLLEPTVMPATSKEDGVKKMVAPIIQLKTDGNLTEDKKVKLQTNGTCSHSCIMAWLQINLSADLFRGFELFAIQRANARLDKVAQSPEFVGVSIANFAEIQTSLKASGTELEDNLVKGISDRKAQAQTEANSTYAKILKKSKNQAPTVDTKYLEKRNQKLTAINVERITSTSPSTERKFTERAADAIGALFRSKQAKDRLDVDSAVEKSKAKQDHLKKKIVLANQYLDAQHSVHLMNRFAQKS